MIPDLQPQGSRTVFFFNSGIEVFNLGIYQELDFEEIFVNFENIFKFVGKIGKFRDERNGIA